MQQTKHLTALEFWKNKWPNLQPNEQIIELMELYHDYALDRAADEVRKDYSSYGVIKQSLLNLKHNK